LSPGAFTALIISLKVATVATLLDVAIGVPLAYLLARKTFRLKWLVDLATTLPLVLPPTVTGYYLIVLLGRNGWLGHPLFAFTGWSITFTWGAAVIASAVMGCSWPFGSVRKGMGSFAGMVFLANGFIIQV
jgi:molybdate transport system permease protein